MNSTDTKTTLTPMQAARRAMADGDLAMADSIVSMAIHTNKAKPELWHLWLRIAVIQGKVHLAKERSIEALKACPSSPMLRAIDAQIEASAGNAKTAIMRLNHAIQQWPSNYNLRLQKLRILRDRGRTLAALTTLRNLRKGWFDKEEVKMACIGFYRDHGRIHSANIVIESLLKAKPDHAQARIIKLMTSGTISSNNEPSSTLHSILSKAESITEVSASDIAVLLQSVKLITQPELFEVGQKAINLIAAHSKILSEWEKLALLNQAERFGLSHLAKTVLKEILATGPSTVFVANALFKKSLYSAEHHRVKEISLRLLQHIPQHKKNFLLTQFSLVLDGPKRALKRLQSERCSQRSLPEVYNVVRILWEGNFYHFASRYLRFCRRRWPEDPELRLQHARFLRESGQPQEALIVLQGPIPSHKRISFSRIRAHCLLEIGQAEAALALLDKISHPNKSTNGIRDLHLRITIMLGNVKRAYDIIQEGRQQNNDSSISSGHFSISQIGSLLNDLVLYHRETDSINAKSHDEALCPHYVQAASSIIRHQSKKLDHFIKNRKRFIPARVCQYWNEKHPPQEVIEIMTSWSKHPDIEYKRFNSNEAKNFLRKTYGPNYERAFRLANNIAEGADFFRLCYLRYYGGLYADADDLLYGKLANLLPPDADMLCFLEPFGVIANNVIACVPNHPAIVLASEMAAEALLSRDNDNTWSKTGPGLLTRAVACYLINFKRSSDKKITIMPAHMLRREVQVHMMLPHKKTKRHWNTTKNQTTIDIQELIGELKQASLQHATLDE